MTTHEVLVGTRKLIEDPTRWAQGCAAQDSDGTRLPDDDPSAAKLCVSNAMSRVLDGERGSPPHRKAQDAFAAATGDGDVGIGPWNDAHSHVEVLAALDKAIAATAPAPDMSWLKEPESVPA